MIAAVVWAALLVTIAAAQIVLPGRSFYHAGWFNVAIVAAAAVCIGSARGSVPRDRSVWARSSVAALVISAIVAGAGIVYSGLFLPDNRTIIGAPDTQVAVNDAGAMLDFPSINGATPSAVTLDRLGRGSLPIGQRARSAGTFVFWSTMRDVVRIQARDSGGNHVTITQPSGTSFLSPVLLMTQHQALAGLDVPFDSFAVPATHRIVKAVLFNAAQAARMRGLMAKARRPAVLFAVDDQDDRPLPRAIALAGDGDIVSVGGLQLRGDVLPYPAVQIAAAPPLLSVVAAMLLLLYAVGALVYLRESKP